jgi:hypothetical protein
MIAARLTTLLGCAAFVALATVAGCAKGVGDAPSLDAIEPEAGGPAGEGKDSSAGQAPDTGNTGEDAGDPDSTVPAKDSSTPKDASEPDASGSDSAAPDAADSSVVCATVPPNHLCGLVPQCGCPAGQTCDVTSDQTGSTSCITAGAGVQGSPCSSTGGCQLGLTCIFGACRPYCAAAGQACPNAGFCIDPPYDMQGHTTPNRHTCTIDCDLRSPAGACPGNGCDYYQGLHKTDCGKAGGLDQGQLCNTHADCKPGFSCAQVAPISPFYACMGWCRIGHNEDCSGSSCTDYFGSDAPNQGGSKLGLCN